MATPTITTSAIPPGSTVYVLASPPSGFQTLSFANDLFNSLAPLLTLFGEQPTRQYLSMSLSLADHVLLGIAPIGILTIVVSAIRISGSPLLKALVGRSRENKASVEAEVLSSTSTRVRELWDGERIVKEAGGSRTTEVIYNQRPGLKTGKMQVQTFPDAVVGNSVFPIYRLQTNLSGIQRLQRIFGYNIKVPDDYENTISDENRFLLKERLETEAPNISLNVPRAVASRAEIWALGATGYILQLGVLAIAGLSVYRFDWRASKGASIPGYAFPTFASGTILMTMFATICGYIIEATTTKETYEPAYKVDKGEPNPYKVFRVQSESTVGRQDVPAYAIFNDLADPLIRTVRPNMRQFEALTWVSAAMTVIGFAAQFIGIRAMHWSIALMQLGVTFLNTGLRMLARRGVTRCPEVLPLETGWEAADLALHIRTCEKWQLMTGEVAGAIWQHTELSASQAQEGQNSMICDLYRDADGSPEPSTKKTVRWFKRKEVSFEDGSKTPRNLGHRTMELHRRLQKIFPCDEEIETTTSNVCEAIDQICQFIVSSKDVVLANLDTVGQPSDPYIRPFFDILVKGKTLSSISSGLIKLGFTVKWPVDGEEEILGKDSRKRIRSIISLTYRSLGGNSTRPSDDSIYRRRTYFMRILGHEDPRRIIRQEEDDDDRPLPPNRSLRKWLDHGMSYPNYHKIPFPDGLKPMLAVDASVETSPVFGMKFSSLCKAANLTSQLSLVDSVAETSSRKRRDKKSAPVPAATELVFLSDTNLLNNIALDILSTFILTLTAEIENVGGTTTEVQDKNTESRRWENNVLEKLSHILIDVGLASNMATAKSVIIPAFASRWLLPPKTARTAAEGIQNAQLPADWTRRIAQSGRTYFANHKTRVTSWTHPWYQKPDDMWQEMHSATPPPTYTAPAPPKLPKNLRRFHMGLGLRKPSYPPSLIPPQVHSRGAYLHEEATGSVAGPASIYSEVFSPRKDEWNDDEALPRPASH